jgi:hypothetical protein
MSYEAKIYNVFIASPGDVKTERSIAREVVSDWNAVHADADGVILQAIGWDTHSFPDMGDRAQGIINRQTLEKSDILVAIFKHRVGTATTIAESGTIEEIENHLKSGRPTMIYFSSQDAPPNADTGQLEAVRRVEKNYRDRGLIETFENPEDFRRKFTRQCAQRMVEYLRPKIILELIELLSKTRSKSDRQEKPILEIQDLNIAERTKAEQRHRFTLNFMIENVGNVVCQTHLVIVRIPLKIRSRQVIIDDEQPEFNGTVYHFIDDKSQSPAHVVEISGKILYPGYKVTKALRILDVNFTGPLNELSSKTENIVSINLFSDPPSEVKGQTQMPVR